MARSFDGTNTKHLDTASASVTAYPLSGCAWVKLAALGGAAQAFNIGTSASGDNRWALSVNATNFPVFTARDTASVAATSLLDIQDTTKWHVMSFSTASATSRIIYWDGGNRVSNGANKTPGVPNVMRISGSPDGLNNFNGLIAHVALWNIALSDQDHANLARFPPNLIQAASLVEYWPLMGNNSPEPSFGTAATAMTVTGSPYVADGPTFDPRSGRIGSFIGVMP